MIKKLVPIFIVGLMLCGAVDASAQTSLTRTAKKNTASGVKTSKTGKKVIVYYFHGYRRCGGCGTLEAYSKEAVEKYFAKEIQNGKVEYLSVNTDDEVNKHFLQDYQIYTKSLVVTLWSKDKQVKYEVLKDTWTLLGNKDQFFQYVKKGVGKYAAEAKK